MSLVTTCPACRTTFIVKPEHLAAHRGDVRCGQCQHLFNALSHLTEAELPEPTSEVVRVATPADVAPVEAPEVREVAEALAALRASGVDLLLEAEAPLTPVVTPEHPPYPSLVDPDLVPAEPAPEPPFAPATAPEPSPSPALTPEPAPEDEPVALPFAGNLGGSDFLAPPVPRSRAAQWLMGLLAVVLMFTAMGQWVYFQRSDLAVRLPQARPWLEQMCQRLQCRVELPRKADLLMIEDSDLQEDGERTGAMRLSSTLANHAHFPQEFPQLELTLTDMEDHAVLRRIFSPQEYLPRDLKLADGMPADGEIHVKLTFSTGDIKPVGYRVYISYP